MMNGGSSLRYLVWKATSKSGTTFGAVSPSLVVVVITQEAKTDKRSLDFIDRKHKCFYISGVMLASHNGAARTAYGEDTAEEHLV